MPSSERMRTTVEHDVAMTTRDGVTLVADVHRPADGAPVPALLHRTAYGKQTAAMITDLIAEPAELAAHGYAVVVQDVRGRFASGGEWVPFVHERDDGHDAVEWAAAQPWCDGQVGVYGSSYMGITAYQAVLANPPHLAAAATVVSGCDLNDGLARTGGAYELGFVSLWSVSTALDTIGREADPARRAELGAAAAAAGADPWAVVRGLPLRDGIPVGLTGWLDDWLTHEPHDPYWDATTLRGSDVHVPLLQVVGFRDWMQRSMLRLWDELGQDHALIAGPWTHRSAYGGDSGLRDWSADAPGGPAGHTPRLLAWFDRWLRGGSGGGAAEHPRASWFVTGEDVWRHGDTFPPPTTDLAIDVVTEPALLRHDPADPVPTCGGMIAMPLFGPDGVQDRTAIGARDDVLTWTGDASTTPLSIAGRARLEVVLTADAPDADLMIMLVDVTPDGVAEPVTEGVQRLRYRLGTHDAWLRPDEPVTITIELAATAHTWRAGHRVRVEIAGSNFPRFSRTSGSRDVPEHAVELRPVTLRIERATLTLPTVQAV